MATTNHGIREIEHFLTPTIAAFYIVLLFLGTQENISFVNSYLNGGWSELTSERKSKINAVRWSLYLPSDVPKQTPGKAQGKQVSPHSLWAGAVAAGASQPAMVRKAHWNGLGQALAFLGDNISIL